MYKHILTHLARLLCEHCKAAPGTVYADDEVTPLCGACWWRLYGEGNDASK